jgi:hypothetical protein
VASGGRLRGLELGVFALAGILLFMSDWGGCLRTHTPFHPRARHRVSSRLCLGSDAADKLRVNTDNPVLSLSSPHPQSRNLSLFIHVKVLHSLPGHIIGQLRSAALSGRYWPEKLTTV